MPQITIFPGTPREMTRSWQAQRCNIGRAATNDIQLDVESISSYHARIEQRETAFWLIDLNSTNGSFVNGQHVREARLKDGDQIRLGEVLELRFGLRAEEHQLGQPVATTVEPPAPVTPPTPWPPQQTPYPPQQTPMPPSPQPFDVGLGDSAPVPPSMAMARQGNFCPTCQTFIPFSVNFCPRCGQSIGGQNLPALPNRNLPAPMGGPLLGEFVRPMEPPGQGVGIFPLLALLCGLSVIGFPFAIILGLVALAQIRRYGGFGADRRQATAGIALGFFWAMVFAVVGLWYGRSVYVHSHEEVVTRQHSENDKRIAENEAVVIDELKGIARAEKFARATHFKDPHQTGTGQYLTLVELSKVSTSSFPRQVASGKSNGYVFSIRDVNQTGYQAVAEPERYGVTGKRTFAIGPTGVVRAQDLEGKSFAQAEGALAELTEIKTAFDGLDDAIATEAIAYAKQLAAQGKYDQVRLILDDIRDQFAMTTAAQDLQALKKNVDPFIVEAQAQGKYQLAQKAAADGDLKRSVGLLKDITELYPSFTKIAQVTDELNKQQTTIIQQADHAAKELSEKAEQLERDGKPEAALELYVQIEKNYPETDSAKRMTDLKPAVQQAIREKSAEQLLVQARNLPIDTNYRDVVNALDQLKRNYADTDFVHQNETSIKSLHHKAQAQLYRSLAIEQMTAGHDGGALARLEEATTNNPDLRPALRDLFLKLYVRVAQKRIDEGDEREALTLYRKYLALQPEQSEISPAVLSRLSFTVAKSEFALGNIKTARQNLVAARPAFANDAEFNDLFGSVEVAVGNYDEALGYFDRAVTTKPTVADYWARRGYTQLLIALQTEQDAMAAFAGLLRATPAMPPPAADPTQVAAPTPPTPPAPADGTDPGFGPTFATVLPSTVTGKAPEIRVKYDALASQNLRDKLLNVLDQIRATSAPPGSTKTKPSGQSNIRSNSDGAVSSNPSPTEQRTVQHIDRLRTGVELGNAVSALHQAVLDNNARKRKTADAIRRMAALFAGGDRDLTHAIQLKADRSAELVEILKATRLHERKIADAAPKIAAYLETEIEVADHAYQIIEQMFRTLRVQQLGAASDPTPTLDVYFAKLFDRRGFDDGVELLREASEIKVPLDGYSVTQQPPPNPNAPAAPLPAPVPAPAVAPAVAPAIKPVAQPPQPATPPAKEALAK